MPPIPCRWPNCTLNLILRARWALIFGKVKNSGSYYQFGVTLPFIVAKNLTLTPGVAYTRGFDNSYQISGQPDFDNGAAVGRVVMSLSLGYTF